MRVYCLIILVVLVSPARVRGQLKVPGMDNFKKVMTDCSIDYEMKCEYPGGQVYNLRGTMAVQGNNFYDSSNVRYVLLNNDWYIIADHLLKEISVAYIHDINKELEGIAAITASTFLFNNDFFSDVSEVRVVKQNRDTSWLSLKFKDTGIIQELNIQTLRKNLQPVRYSAVINYPLGGYGDDEIATVKLTMDCFNISAPANRHLFDDRRLITKNGKKVTLKKFNTYKAYN